MRLRYVLAGVLGLLVAGGAVVSAKLSLLQDTENAQEPLTAMAEVYVAAADIPFGSLITPDHVTTQRWPREAVHYEEFLAPQPGKPFEVKLAVSNKVIQVGEQESLLEIYKGAVGL